MDLKHSFLLGIFTALLLIHSSQLWAQAGFGVQLFQRAEFRNGYGKLLLRDESPAAFIGHRARLHVQYPAERFTIFASIQDVRIFGSVPQLNATDSRLSAHEVWGEYRPDSNWTLRVGRQELHFDNARFLGNVDWTFQGRSHDFVLLRYRKGGFRLDAGGGFNQGSERLSGNFFTVSPQYKTAQMLRIEKRLGNLDVAALIWNDGRSQNSLDSVGNIISEKINYLQNFGISSLRFRFFSTSLSGFFYMQTGKDAQGRRMEAFDVSAQYSTEIGLSQEHDRKLVLTTGVEVMSGSRPGNGTNRSYVPLYGTNHAHNGYMDYFFAGGRHENSVGLVDVFLKTKLECSKRLFVSANAHWFRAQVSLTDGSLADDPGKQLGVEADLTLGWIVTGDLSLQLGYSHFFAGDAMKYLQGNGDFDALQHWGYAMLIYRPGMGKPFTGLLL